MFKDDHIKVYLNRDHGSHRSTSQLLQELTSSAKKSPPQAPTKALSLLSDLPSLLSSAAAAAAPALLLLALESSPSTTAVEQGFREVTPPGGMTSVRTKAKNWCRI